jgi:hypothetical protein
MKARAVFIEGTELAELMRGAVVAYMVSGGAYSIDGKGMKAAVDAAPSKCALAPTPPTPAQTQAQVDQIAAELEKQRQAMLQIYQNTGDRPIGAPTTPTPTPPAKLNPPAPPATPPSAGPPSAGPSTPGNLLAQSANPGNLSPDALALMEQQKLQLLLQQQQLQQGNPKAMPIANAQCSATAISRMQALPLTNAQITQICR